MPFSPARTTRLIRISLLALVCIIFAQRQAELSLWGAWQTEEYSHGILIPIIAALLAWHLLVEAKPVVKPSWWGVVWLAAAGVLQVAARLSAFDTLAEYGLIVGITGIVLGFFGRAVTRAIAPALVYLVFAVPLPHLVQSDLSQDLQLLSSSLGVAMLDAVGIPVFQQGNVIDLGGFQLQVVEACDGLRYLFPLMSFGYLLAFLFQGRWWKRIVIFLSTIPIALGLNALRIAFIGLTVDLWGPHMAEGFIHGFEGWCVFLLCIGVLMIEIWVLQHIGGRGRFRYEYFGIARGRLFGDRVGGDAPAFAALAMAALLGVLFGGGFLNLRDEVTPPHAPFASFPLSLGDWRGHAGSIDADMLQALQMSDYWIADYKQGEGGAVNLYISYYASQRAGAMTHSPSNCIPGGGWQIENSRVESVALPSGEKLRLTRLLIRRGDEGELVYYFFDERGRDITETTAAKWYLLRDSIIMHRTDGALIRLVTPLAKGESEAAGDKRLADFLGVVWPVVGRFVPGR